MPSELEQRQIAKRDNLYFNYHYRNGSYKARKMYLELGDRRKENSADWREPVGGTLASEVPPSPSGLLNNANDT